MALYAFLPSSHRRTSERTLFGMSLGRLTSLRVAVPSRAGQTPQLSAWSGTPGGLTWSRAVGGLSAGDHRLTPPLVGRSLQAGESRFADQGPAVRPRACRAAGWLPDELEVRLDI